MMKTGTAVIGQKISSPDGKGKVVKILNPDTVVIELERFREDPKTKKQVPLYAQFDLSECASLEPAKKKEAEPQGAAA